MDIGDDQPVFGENTFSLHYRKINNRDLFSSLENSELGIKSSRNYTPLYETYFNLNETNYTSINLNQRFYVSALSGVVDKNNIQAAVVDAFKSTSDSLTIVHKPIFIKFSPLIDPVKYMSGKYVEYVIGKKPTQMGGGGIGNILEKGMRSGRSGRKRTEHIESDIQVKGRKEHTHKHITTQKAIITRRWI